MNQRINNLRNKMKVKTKAVLINNLKMFIILTNFWGSNGLARTEERVVLFYRFALTPSMPATCFPL